MKKSQISIFIVFLIIIIIGGIFIATLNFETKEKKLEENVLNLENSENTIRNYFEVCFQDVLNKGIILSSLKGGYIFEKNEFNYIPLSKNIINKNNYSKANININEFNSTNIIIPNGPKGFSNLNSKILNEYDKNYNFTNLSSIENDLENYILLNSFDCFNNKNLLENFDYELIYDNYFLDKNYSFGNLEIEKNNFSKSGDLVLISITKNFLSNIPINYKINLPTTLEKKDILDKLILKKIAPKINVRILKNQIEAEINFDISIIKKNEKIELDNFLVIQKTNYYYQYYVAKDILLKYKNRKKNINNISSKIDFNLKTNYLKNISDEKIIIYSIIDNNSKISGLTNIFNIGYYNKAPSFFLENENVKIENENLIKINVSNINFPYNFFEHFSENNPYDKNINFSPKSFPNGINLTQNGILLSFENPSDSFGNFNISDGETFKNYSILFIDNVTGESDCDSQNINIFENNFNIPSINHNELSSETETLGDYLISFQAYCNNGEIQILNKYKVRNCPSGEYDDGSNCLSSSCDSENIDGFSFPNENNGENKISNISSSISNGLNYTFVSRTCYNSIWTYNHNYSDILCDSNYYDNFDNKCINTDTAILNFKTWFVTLSSSNKTKLQNNESFNFLAYNYSMNTEDEKKFRKGIFEKTENIVEDFVTGIKFDNTSMSGNWTIANSSCIGKLPSQENLNLLIPLLSGDYWDDIPNYLNTNKKYICIE